MKKMTFQISEKKYQEILRSERNSVSRFVYPTNVTRYVYFKCNGVEYKRQDDVPDDELSEICPVMYDALCLICGTRKNAPRIEVEVVSAEVAFLTDENENITTYMWKGEEYLDCIVIYHLGKIIEKAN